ncbi:MAG: PAS domain S-box protein [Planctomycetota bacterium]|nr:PAS domain S-box protein [Planctomycetota bacterium]
MKTEHKVFILFLVAGLAVWVLEASFEAVWQGETLGAALLFDVPLHQLCARFISLGFFIVFGFVAAVYAAQRRRAAKALREERDLAEGLIETAQTIVLVLDAKGRIVRFNRYMEEISGYRLAEVKGKDWFTTFLPARDHAKIRNLFSKAINDIQTRGNVNPIVTKDGRERLIGWYDKAIKGADGKTIGLLAVGQDITEREKAIEALTASERRYRRLVETMNEGLGVRDKDGRITYVNDSLCRMLGYSRQELIGRDVMSLTDGISKNILREQVAKHDAGQTSTYEINLTSKDGLQIPTLVSAQPIFDSEGNIEGGFAVITDLTEYKKLEAELRHAHKMEAIGRLAGGVAHDFNNQLTVIKGYCDLLLGKLPKSNQSRTAIGEIRTAGERAAKLTSQLLAFGRKQVLRPEAMNLNEVLSQMYNPLARLIGEDIELKVIPAPELGNVKADPIQVEQAIMNLATNARDAMPNGGKFTIKTANIKPDIKHLCRYPDAKPVPYVMLAISDTGEGMDKQTLQTIFEPFFTTKEVGKGTGLGLAMVYGFVRQSGGHIDVASKAGRGTTFKIYLPRVKAQPRGSKPLAPAMSYRGTETVLVVEDQEPLRDLIVHELRDRGYTVLEAANALEALPLGEHYAKPIDLLITDVVMPGTSGVELVDRLRGVRPHMQVLYISGYSAEAYAGRGVRNDDELLQKPFTPDELAAAVRKLLDSAKKA